MKTVFDERSRAELISRINSLNENSTAQWGKMNVYQMVKHCTLWEAWILGKSNLKYKQAFIGLIFGKMALNSSVKDDKPMKRNIPAGREFIVREKNGNIELQKKKWISLIDDYVNFSNHDFIHDFFGKMTKDQNWHFCL